MVLRGLRAQLSVLYQSRRLGFSSMEIGFEVKYLADLPVLLRLDFRWNICKCQSAVLTRSFLFHCGEGVLFVSGMMSGFQVEYLAHCVFSRLAC
jgi:hypothetical protein